MKAKYNLVLTVLILNSFLLGCSDSPTEVQHKTNLITRSWNGEEFFLMTVNDSTFKGKDLIQTFEFKNDGSYFLYQYTMSSMGEVGQWKFEENGNKIRLTRTETRSEVFSIMQLTSTSFVIGDTNSRGYKLVSK